MIDLFAFEQVIPEFLAQFYGDIAKGAFAADKFLEVVVNTIPFLVLLPCLCPEVGEEIYLLFLSRNPNSSLISDWTRIQRIASALFSIS